MKFLNLLEQINEDGTTLVERRWSIKALCPELDEAVKPPKKLTDPARPWIDNISGRREGAPIGPDGNPTPEQIAWIRDMRERVREEEGETTGMCHIVSEIIENKLGWERWGGVYTASNGDMICSAHLFNILPNGSLLDATADQFGEGHDIRVIHPDDPEYQRYRMEWMEDYNPSLAKDYPELKGVAWSGEYDADAQDRLRRKRGERWWVPRKTKATPKRTRKVKESIPLEDHVNELLNESSPTPGLFFHGTSIEHIPSILAHGLIPRSDGGNYSGFHQSIPGVYLTPDRSHALTHADITSSTNHKNNGMCVIEVELQDFSHAYPDEDCLTTPLYHAISRAENEMSIHDIPDSGSEFLQTEHGQIVLREMNAKFPMLHDLMEELVAGAWEMVILEIAEGDWWSELLDKAVKKAGWSLSQGCYLKSFRVAESIGTRGANHIVRITNGLGKVLWPTTVSESRLDEIHYTDLYPRSFEEFHKKYRNLIRQKGTNKYNLYVQFTNWKDNTLDRTAYEDTDHTDPMGVYTYPLSYVISHPADIWYGANARYLRVIEATPKNPLYLKDIQDWHDVERILYRMGLNNEITMLNKIKRNYRHKGRKAPLMTFMRAVQNDHNVAPKEKTGPWEKGKEWPTRSAKEQTMLFLKAGYDAIIDQGTGAINQREPEQTVFLTRASFRVKEVFTLRPGQGEHDLIMTHPNPDGNEILLRKIASAVAMGIGDKLEGKNERANLNGWAYYWTKNGNRIEIAITRPNSYYNLPMGEKPHKYDRKGTGHIIEITVQTAYGPITVQERDSMAKLDDIVAKISKAYRAAEANGSKSDWTPENRDSFLIWKKKQDEFNTANYLRKRNFMEPLKSMAEYEEMQKQGLNPLGVPHRVAGLQDDYRVFKLKNRELAQQGKPQLNWQQFMARMNQGDSV